jgi:hypothetical protein
MGQIEGRICVDSANRHTGAAKGKTEIERRWQSRNRRRHESTLGSDPGRSCESEASRRREVVGEEIGGEEGSGKEAPEEGGVGSRSGRQRLSKGWKNDLVQTRAGA